MKTFLLRVGLSLLVPTALFAAQPEPLPPQASIPFVNHGGIWSWQAVDRDTLYIQDRRRRWYRADLIGPCLNLDYALRVGFIGGATDTFDRFSYVQVGRQRCPVNSLTRSGPPPKRERHQRS